jgi:hypothetical protein
MKNDRERGFYLHPELYGAPEDRSYLWSRQPGMMSRIKQLQESRKSRASTTERTSTHTPTK